MFDKEKLKELNDINVEKVNCPEWGEQGDEIYVRSMTGRSRDNYEMGLVAASKVAEDARLYNFRAMMAVACCCDKDGELLFDPSDAEWIGGKSAAALDRIVDAAKRISRMMPEDVKAMEKTLEDAQN